MQNSVLTKLKQAGFSAELIDFLLQFYIGAVNVYGIISLDDLYDLFQKIKEHNAAYPEITSEQFISFGELTDGQSGTYYLVYNPAVFDKYSKQVDDSLTSPLLVNKKVTWTEINIQQIWNLYLEICQECGRLYLTPENLLDYATHEENEDEKNFRQALSELKLDGKKLDKVASRIIPGDTAVNEIINLVTYIYQAGAGVLYDAENELQFAFEYYKLKLSQREFKEMSTMMKQAVYEQPCWGLGGRSYVEVKGYDTGDDFDEIFYDEDDDDFFDWEDDEGLLEEDSDIDSNSLHDLLLGLADSEQPQDKIVNKVSYPKRLLDKNMKKRYAKAGFTEEKLDFLHKFFQEAVNLYGVIEIIDLSQIYADILPKVKRLNSLKPSGTAGPDRKG